MRILVLLCIICPPKKGRKTSARGPDGRAAAEAFRLPPAEIRPRSSGKSLTHDTRLRGRLSTLCGPSCRFRASGAVAPHLPFGTPVGIGSFGVASGHSAPSVTLGLLLELGVVRRSCRLDQSFYPDSMHPPGLRPDRVGATAVGDQMVARPVRAVEGFINL